ncbi:stemmadenine O-acetyltransferase-like [Corylus avellana]|uniref:stemmadenine O-acetyltransferase-like n=1 Tax=Corylus avellana TaxID=13451 RepID=UPI001E21B070|nr:stemmadenine O-acetyltransferase-like [Corylus avellana]
MATLSVEVISKEIVKPSSPTPNDLHHYQLSFNDQMSPPVYNPLSLFYASDGDTKFNVDDISDRLKKSLSEVLTLYYPLAGRIKDNSSIDCNDKGIPFLQARVDCQLSDVVQNPVPGELNKLVPFELDTHTDIAFGVQLNVFECGGIAVGACISHKVADALSYFVFVRCWAAIACGDKDVVSPQFVAATLFPPKNISGGGFVPGVGITKDNIITNRYVFDASKIEALKEKYADQEGIEKQKPPSRVEALSAFIWNRFVAATKDESGPEKLYSVHHAVNLRPRFEPPQPESSFGNLFSVAITVPKLNSTGEEDDHHGLMRQVREQIKKIDADYVKKLQQQGNQFLDFMRDHAAKFIKGEVVTFSFTSLCRFPLYEADFGWGKPTWFGSPALTFKNLVFFVDTPSGDGIEAYVSLKKEDMAKFQSDEEFHTFVSQT